MNNNLGKLERQRIPSVYDMRQKDHKKNHQVRCGEIICASSTAVQTLFLQSLVTPNWSVMSQGRIVAMQTRKLLPNGQPPPPPPKPLRHQHCTPQHLHQHCTTQDSRPGISTGSSSMK